MTVFEYYVSRRKIDSQMNEGKLGDWYSLLALTLASVGDHS